jgi:hypothetical protein
MPLVMNKKPKTPYKEIYGAYLDAQRSITVGNEKILVYPNVPTIRVYDIDIDPFEADDIAKTKKGKAIISKLFPRLLELQKSMEDTLDLTVTFPQFSSKK